MKLSIGFLSGSKALVADSLYSIKDIASSVVILISLKISQKDLDAEHPYGHGKVEFIASMVISVFLIFASLYFMVGAIDDIMNNPHEQPPHMIAIVAAVISVMANIYFYKFTRCVAFQSNSPLIKTVSMHNEADALSSTLVVIALCGTHFGLLLLDPIVAVLETLHLAIISMIVLKNAYGGLMDKSMPEDTNNLIKKVAKRVTGVKTIKVLRTRQLGQHIWIEITVGVDPELSIDIARSVAEIVEERILSEIPHAGNALVHFVSHEEGETVTEEATPADEQEPAPVVS